MVYGDLELHPYIHQKGNNAGRAAITPQIMVKDWQFLPANRNDTNAATPAPGNPMVGNPNIPPENSATYSGSPAIGMNPSGTMPTGTMPDNNNMIQQAAQQMSYAPAGGASYAPQGLTAGNVYGDGFTNVPENTPPQQLPFPQIIKDP
nr:hypothetical protein [Mediterraneibacter glycyrrhizinilyticus]